VTTSTGGHIGWLDGSLFKEDAWMDNVATEFLQAAQECMTS